MVEIYGRWREISPRLVGDEERADVELLAEVDRHLRDRARAQVVPIGGVDVRRRRLVAVLERRVQQPTPGVGATGSG